jgi:hypothetical protein
MRTASSTRSRDSPHRLRTSVTCSRAYKVAEGSHARSSLLCKRLGLVTIVAPLLSAALIPIGKRELLFPEQRRHGTLLMHSLCADPSDLGILVLAE